jgi:hypothetical protein
VPRKPYRVPAIIWAHEVGVQGEVETIRRYLDSVTSSFAREIEEHLARLPDHMTDEDAEWYGEQYAETQTYYIDLFPAFALETTFVATYAFLEDEMMGICRLVGSELHIKIGPENLKDKGIEAARTYLEKLCDITVPNDRPWQQAKMYGLLRNVFAHTRGRVKPDNKPVQQYVAANPDKLSIQKDRLRITKEFCLEVLDDVEKLLKSLLHLARERITNR